VFLVRNTAASGHCLVPPSASPETPALRDLNALLIPASAMNTTTGTTSVASWQPGKGERK
jgi:hypothetical protein